MSYLLCIFCFVFIYIVAVFSVKAGLRKYFLLVTFTTFCPGSWMQHISPPSPLHPAAFSSLCFLPASRQRMWQKRESACEGKRGKPSVEWICALSPPPFSFLLSSVSSLASFTLLRLRCVLGSFSVGPWWKGISPGGRGTENWTSMSAGDQKKGGDKPKGKHTNTVCLMTTCLNGQHPLLKSLKGCKQSKSGPAVLLLWEEWMKSAVSSLRRQVRTRVLVCGLWLHMKHQHHPPSQWWRVLQKML